METIGPIIESQPLNNNFAELNSGLTTKSDKAYVDQQLALKSSQADLDATNAVVSQKADKSYVDSLISGVGDMSPKGAYATLAELQAAYPTGADGIYLVSADNHWYYWNGSAWTDGGPYQAMPWADFMTTQDEPWEV